MEYSVAAKTRSSLGVPLSVPVSFSNICHHKETKVRMMAHNSEISRAWRTQLLKSIQTLRERDGEVALASKHSLLNQEIMIITRRRIALLD